MNLPQQITLCEVVLRDGLQNEPKVLATGFKRQLLEDIQDAGVKLIEVGSFVNPRAVPQVADTDLLFANAVRREGVEYRALVLNFKGLQRAAACGVTKAKLTVSASLSHQRANANTTHEEIFAGFEEMAAFAAAQRITLSGAISTAFGCPFEGAVSAETLKAIVRQYLRIGVTELSLSDTTGMGDPLLVYRLVSEMKDTFPQVMWNLHFHNTRGMGLANVFAAMQAGADRFDASIGGMGGCPFAPGADGNIASEDVLHMCELMGVDTGVDLDKVIAMARRLQDEVGHPLSSSLLKAGKNSELADLATAKMSGSK
ncbi:MAG: hydroxymethylglutaryl-CoA lyase [Bacillota bacterium]|nr:hydroxymethylglutaryl-CoA lyase [Bacillota bacterium]